MTLNQTILLVTFFANSALAVLVFSKNWKSVINRSLGLFIIAIAIWNLSIFFVQISGSMVWGRLSFASAAIIPGAFFIFSKIFTKHISHQQISRITYLLIVIPSIFFFFVALTTDLILKKVEVVDSVLTRETGVLYIFFGIYFVLYAFISFYILYKRYRISTGIFKMQIRYLFIGTFIFAFIGVITNLLFPLIGNFNFNELGPLFSVIMMAFFTYAIVQYRLMDIRLVIRRVVVYIGLGLFALAAYYLVAWSDTVMFGGVFTVGGVFSAIVFVPLFLAGFYYLGQKLRTVANKYFFASLYDYQKTLDRFAEDVTSTINLGEVAGVTVKTIKQTMQIDNIGLFVKNKHYEAIKIIGFDEQDLTRMVSNPRCRNFITALRKPLVYDELAGNIHDFQQPQEEVEHARDQMKELDVAIVLPLVTKGELISCIIMGKKISGDAYTQEDMRLLESLANQAAISIENARLYNEVQGFNQTLKQKVDDATKRLRELLKIKSDFLTVASHQLRTPTSIVRGMLSLVIEEKDLSNEEKNKFVTQAYEGVNRLERIIHELLNATELEGKKMRLEFKKTRVENIIEEIINELTPLAEQEKVKINFNKPARSIPKTLADPVKLKEAITNIIDNAVHYTPEGEVDVSVRRKQDQIIVEVSDTGIGMSKNDLRMLFTKFSRGEGILQIHPNGTGLGLFIAKKMLEAMGGTITAESKGKSKGSKFTLAIPIK